MPMYIDEEQENRELQLLEARAAIAAKDRALARKHELEVVKAKLAVTKTQKRGLARTEAVQRILLALIKLPAIPFVVGLIRLYKKGNGEVPQQLWDFLNF